MLKLDPSKPWKLNVLVTFLLRFQASAACSRLFRGGLGMWHFIWGQVVAVAKPLLQFMWYPLSWYYVQWVLLGGWRNMAAYPNIWHSLARKVICNNMVFTKFRHIWACLEACLADLQASTRKVIADLQYLSCKCAAVFCASLGTIFLGGSNNNTQKCQVGRGSPWVTLSLLWP